MGLTGGRTPAGPGGQVLVAGATAANLRSYMAGVGSWGSLGAWLLFPCSPRPPGIGEVPCSWPLLFSLLFVFICLCPASHPVHPLTALQPVCLCSWSLPLFLSQRWPPYGLLPPWSLPPSPCTCLSSSLPSAPLSLPLADLPLPLWAVAGTLSGSPYLCVFWPGLHVPLSPGACAWVGMGVSLEKSLSASPLQLQAGCCGNRVRGPPLQQLSCGLGEGWRPWGQPAPQCP